MPRDRRDVLEEDRIRLTHMLESAQRALRFCADKTVKDLECDEMLLLAVLKSIEVVGEASVKISEETKSQLSTIDWRTVRRTRNRLIHGYDTINIPIVWDTVQVGLPTLVQALTEILAAWPPEPESEGR